MKLEELLNLVDSVKVEEITVLFCGGQIKIEPTAAPFELPNYPIAKIWQTENLHGLHGLTVLLADNIKKDERGAPESVNTETAEKATESANANNAENAEKAAETLRKYCKGFNVCSESCVFYNKNDFGCCVNFPVDYVKKDGGKQ